MNELMKPITLDGLTDAQAMARAHPRSFAVPSAEELAHIIAGANFWVKICRAEERFWVRVEAVDGETITGFIDNDLVNPANAHLLWLQRVVFEKRHCYDIRRLWETRS